MGMVDVSTWIPEGFTAGRHPMVSERLGREIDRLGERGGPMRVTVHVRPGADLDAVEELFAEHPRWQAWRIFPSVWELQILPADMEQLTGRDELFARLDTGGRVTGKTPVLEGTVAVRLVPATGAAMALEAAVREEGGTIAGTGTSGVLARLESEALGRLLALDELEAMEIVA